MFRAIKKLSNNIKSLDQRKLIEQTVSEPYIQTLIVELNQVQLESKGIESDGTRTGDYSKVSVERYGKRPGHITLHDTGEFYRSMKVIVGSEGMVVYGDTIKEGGDDLSKKWPKALGLTEESLSEVRPMVQKKMIELMKERIFR